MISINAVEIRYLVKELQPWVGSYIDNIYQYSRQHLLFQLRKGKKAYLNIFPNVAWLSRTKQEAPKKVGGFCAQLRKLVNNRRIESIEQAGSERIIFLQLKNARLYIELFGKGNIIYVEDIIKAAQFSITYKNRTIAIGQPYEPPQRTNLYELTTLHLGNEPVSKTLANLGLGRQYAEEVCLRANVKPSDLRGDEKKLLQALREVINEQTPTVKNGKLTLYPVKGGTKYPTMSEAIDAIMQASAEPSIEPSILLHQKKMQKAIAIQTKRVEELQQQEQENKRKAESLYAHYQKVDALLKEARKQYKGPHWKEFVKNAKPLLKSVNEKDKELTISLDD